MPLPRLSCCQPYMDPMWPSGSHPTHARNCRVSPGQKAFEDDFQPKLTARLEHPAGTNLPVGGPTSFQIWLSHDDCDCIHCQYVDHWSDRDDDRTLDVAR